MTLNEKARNFTIENYCKPHNCTMKYCKEKVIDNACIGHTFYCLVKENTKLKAQIEHISNICDTALDGATNWDSDQLEEFINQIKLNFFLSTGCRVSELCNVEIADVNLDTKICKVKGKGRKERPVVLTDRCCYRIKLYLETRKDTSPDAPLFAHVRGDEKKMTKDGVGHMVNKISESAGVENVTCHAFRRFYATELRRRGVNIQMIASSLGHANLNQINRYSLYNSDEMLQIVRNAM